MEWRSILGYSGYEVSDEGQVRSFLNRNGTGLVDTPRLMKLSKATGKKYWRVGLRRMGNTVYRLVHILVLEEFVGERPKGHQACHRDDDQDNNRLENLKWATHRENVADKIANGKQVRGSEVWRATLNEEQVRTIKQRLAEGGKRGLSRALAKEFGTTDTVIHTIKTGKAWVHVT
jgi:hypothetical protein